MSYVAVGATAVRAVEKVVDTKQAAKEAEADAYARKKAAYQAEQDKYAAAKAATAKGTPREAVVVKDAKVVAKTSDAPEAKVTQIDNAAPVTEVTPEDGQAPSAAPLEAQPAGGVPWGWLAGAAGVVYFLRNVVK